MKLSDKAKAALLSGTVSLVVSVMGSVASFAWGYYSFYKNLEATQKVEKIHLARELVKDFYAEDAVVFRQVRTAIESCEPLYAGYNKGGKFSNDEINRYLGFFDDMGFYYLEGGLDLTIINQQFGAYIIEANEYDELRRYVNELQNNAKQKTAFVNFQKIAEALETLPERKELAELSRRACHK